MRHYYTADEIREAEAPLLASLPDGVLMRRAAFGLATAIARELLAAHRRHLRPAVCAVVGSGDNGGDALWAATFLRRRARRPPPSCSIRTHPPGGAGGVPAPAAESCKASRRQPIW